MHHLNSTDILVMGYFGFTQEASTNKATHKLTYEIAHTLNSKTQVSRIFCDLAKAVDGVNHSILTTKLAYYGYAIKWFTYVKNGRQGVQQQFHS